MSRAKKKLKSFDLGGSPDILPLIKSKKDGAKLRKKSSLLYKGVRRCHGGKWKAKVKIEGSKVSLGKFADEKEAALVYAKAVWFRKYGNTPREIVGGMDLTDVPKNIRLIQSNRGKSPYKGVVAVGNRWRSYVTFEGKTKALRYYKTVEEAGLMTARAEHYLQSLRPKDMYGGLDLSQTPKDLGPMPNNQPNAGCPYMGIDKKDDRWSAHVFMEGKKKNLGVFDTAKEAGTIHVRAMYHLGWMPRVHAPDRPNEK